MEKTLLLHTNLHHTMVSINACFENDYSYVAAIREKAHVKNAQVTSKPLYKTAN